jgi:hypothetical protein
VKNDHCKIDINTGVQQDSPYPAGRFNEKEFFAGVRWSCSKGRCKNQTKIFTFKYTIELVSRVIL